MPKAKSKKKTTKTTKSVVMARQALVEKGVDPLAKVRPTSKVLGASPSKKDAIGRYRTGT